MSSRGKRLAEMARNSNLVSDNSKTVVSNTEDLNCQPLCANITTYENEDKSIGLPSGNDAVPPGNSSSVDAEVMKCHEKQQPCTSAYVSTLKNPMLISLKKIDQAASYKKDKDSDFSYSEDDDDSFEDPDYVGDNEDTEKMNIDDISSEGSLKNEEIQNSPPKKGKKRTRNPSTWRKEKAKILRNLGKEYQSSSKSGRIFSEKEMGPPCRENCHLKCTDKFSEETRREIFTKYWQLGKLERQRDFLASSIQALQLKYRRVTTQKEPRRPNSAFYLLNKGVRIRVCKTFLRNTLGITDRPIRTIITKKEEALFVPEDGRGRHKNHAKLDDEIRQSVKDHINSIPRIESHYLRQNTSKEFIEGGLTISEMHRNYEQHRIASGKPAATYPIYAKIFNTDFNIGFFKPKKTFATFVKVTRM